MLSISSEECAIRKHYRETTHIPCMTVYAIVCVCIYSLPIRHVQYRGLMNRCPEWCHTADGSLKLRWKTWIKGAEERKQSICLMGIPCEERGPAVPVQLQTFLYVTSQLKRCTKNVPAATGEHRTHTKKTPKPHNKLLVTGSPTECVGAAAWWWRWCGF